ncbi:MAG: DUF927 domain-containing protein, partial [Clostridia bacterium]|nr:DUF927 domain-containing protein [Clostridia bacterium]
EQYIRLCNFSPRIVSEITVDDGTEQTRRYLVSGTDENGQTLPEVEVAASELEKMEWMLNHWDASLDIEVVSQAEKHIRHAMKSTARFAAKKSVFTHTGWKHINGAWEYLMPGGKHDVRLHGKQESYFLADGNADFKILTELLNGDCLPMEIAYICLALVFLSPLNEFLRQVGHEPKFILTLLGRTGSMKSTVAALMLSFFGSFSATDLPMSFRDTANSIIHNAYALKDVLTCVDDYHPCSRRESENMKAIMQTLARSYGDRAARNRMSPEIKLREARPPQGNVIVTAEFAPDIGESGTARLFCIEMKPGKLELSKLTELQKSSAQGELTHIMSAYIAWLKQTHLCNTESFLHDLNETYQQARTEWRNRLNEYHIIFHDRIPDTLTCLQIGFNMMVSFLHTVGMLTDKEVVDIKAVCNAILLMHAARQSDAVEDDRPTHIFVRKFLALIECGHAVVVPLTNASGILPTNCFGYEDEEFYYLFFDAAQRAVKKFCDDQGEDFTVSTKALGKALADEGFINTDGGENTHSKKIGGRSRRVLMLRKDKVRKLMGE